MSKVGCIRLTVALSAWSLVGPILAQTSNKDQMNTGAQPSVESPVSATQDQVQASSEGKEQQVQYAAALDGTGLISLDSSSPSHLLLGATVAGGWDSNPNNLGNGTASGVYALSPYLGIQANTSKAHLGQPMPHTIHAMGILDATGAMGVMGGRMRAGAAAGCRSSR